jgi:glycosyltransferase involved in cell wall biosynthesis
MERAEMRVMFVLPGRGGGGGAHSVVQESIGLQRLGVTVGIATTASTLTAFRVNYPDLEHHRIAIHPYNKAADLGSALGDYDVACATTWESTHVLDEGLRAAGKTAAKAAYYVQDYEPLFCALGSKEWQDSRKSYTLLPDALTFAKTRFLCELVEQNHHRVTEKVSPSIDHGIYYPGARVEKGPLVISAMLRPKTPRRAPRRTARILETLAATLGTGVEFVTFGCQKEELWEAGIRLSERIEHRGPLSRNEVAAVLRASDLFLDLSDYQAFGRTGLEGMACGCIPVLPLFGGAVEFLIHWVNGYLVDTRSDDEILRIVNTFAGLPADVRGRMRNAAIETSLNYSVEKAAFSEFKLFQKLLN